MSSNGPEGIPPSSLTPEQLAALEAGPGLVTDPVADELLPAAEVLKMRDYLTYKTLGNFSGYFTAPESMYGYLIRQRPCRQRFAIIYPELTAKLELFVAMGANTASGRSTDDFIEAYDLMRTLVDRGDPHVLDDQLQVDAEFLTR